MSQRKQITTDQIAEQFAHLHNTSQVSDEKVLKLAKVIKNVNNLPTTMMPNLFGNDKYADIISDLKSELYNLKDIYGNNLSLEELRFISDNDFGGLESNKGKK